MKVIKINTQEELDKLPDTFEEFTSIEIYGLNIIISKSYNNSTITACDNSTITAWANSTITAYDNSTITAYNNSTITACDNSTITACDNSTITACGNSIIKVFEDKTIKELLDNSICICVGDYKINILKKDRTAKFIKQPKVKYNLKKFIRNYKENMIDENHIRLYKSVNPDTLKDFYTNSITYEVGKEVICPDFDKTVNRECGGGLHLCPTKELALSFNKGQLLECKVNIKDIVIFPDDIKKVRCSKVFVIKKI